MKRLKVCKATVIPAYSEATSEADPLRRQSQNDFADDFKGL